MKKAYRPYERMPRAGRTQPVGYFRPLEEAFDAASRHAKETGRIVELRDRDGELYVIFDLRKEGRNNAREE